MSIVEELHVAHKARLARLGVPKSKPVIAKPLPVEPQSADAGWKGMWFWDLLHGVREPRMIVPVREIQEAVCKHYHVSILDLLSNRRSREYALPRQVAMYLCRVLTIHSYTEIGRRFGGRDHTTIIYSCQKVESLIGFDMKLTCDVNMLRSVLA